MERTPRVASVRPAGDMRLLVTFTNGEGRTYDCRPLLERPQFRMLADPGFFRAVTVDVGGYGVSWNDDVDLSEYELWTNGEPVAGSVPLAFRRAVADTAKS
ncbi:MAG: hypothetical protein A3K19_02280 [Lentisphaerae bacterium RIFOXYB12_FULL_65_16]|nr:MAG: hypothetical protein A3K18_30915 [Lentisphaerae bacterium RIFOXYA12_64_32]OGV86703.1 MAG: hypothetical protein A3K19_02280 [Lentisphaerae bacterium RIFOXYB12_FULL_65_16]